MRRQVQVLSRCSRLEGYLHVLTRSLEDALVKKITETSIEIDGFQVASREGLIASKLDRFRLQDRADISALLQLGPVDLSDFPLNEKQQKNLEIALSEIENA